jgi:pyruvate dehydrogenase E2 component (dihydrolipoamide acetyltransferase)
MARPFKLPDLGEGIHEGEVLNVLVSAGDYVKEDDPILEIETDKAAAEIPSPFTGKVEEIKVKVGDTVQVGDVLMTFSEEEEKEEAPKEKEAPEKKEKPSEEEKEKGKEEKAPEKKEEPETKEAEESKKEEGEKRKKQPEEKPEREEGPVPASPATRRLARELQVDLREVSPGGPGGRVTSDDVRSFAEKGKAEKPEKEAPPKKEEKKAEARPIKEKGPELPDFSKWGKVKRVPIRSIRRATARQMALSWSQIPHVHNQDMVDMQKLEEFRAKHKGEIEEKGGKLTITVFALKAAAGALKQFPRFNSSLDVGSGELVIKHYCHIGVAVSTEEGLLVPVIRDVDRKSMVELSIELKDLVVRTRERKVSLEEMQGATFTITNVGPVGGGYFAPVINFPEVAILGLGSIRMTPVARETAQGRYEVVVRPMMPMVLAIDHRVLDGADALQFTKVLMDSLEDPEELLMNMP